MKKHSKSYIEIIPDELQQMKADNINKQIK